MQILKAIGSELTDLKKQEDALTSGAKIKRAVIVNRINDLVKLSNLLN